MSISKTCDKRLDDGDFRACSLYFVKPLTQYYDYRSEFLKWFEFYFPKTKINLKYFFKKTTCNPETKPNHSCNITHTHLSQSVRGPPVTAKLVFAPVAAHLRPEGNSDVTASWTRFCWRRLYLMPAALISQKYIIIRLYFETEKSI